MPVPINILGVSSSKPPLENEDAATTASWMLTPAHLRLTGMPKKGQSTLTARATQDHQKLTGEYQKKEVQLGTEK